MVFDAMGGLEVVTVIFVTLSFVWNIIQAYVFVQERYAPAERRDQFDASAYIMLRELYAQSQTFADAQATTSRILNALSENVQSVAQLHTLLHKAEEEIQSTHTLTRDLHQWHNVTDTNGTRLWYCPRTHVQQCDEIYFMLRNAIAPPPGERIAFTLGNPP